jgi:hypothetical protein
MQAGIAVLCGVPSQEPDEVVKSYLKGTPETGDNACDH